MTKFRVALTAEMHDEAGTPKFKDMGIDVLANEPKVEYAPFAEYRPVIGADQLEGFNGVLVLTPAVNAASLEGAADLLSIARYGVGYDGVDVPACTAADVLLTVTKGCPDGPVAEATIGWMIALTHHFKAKDRLVREGKWDDRPDYMGCELRDRTFGTIGLGGISSEAIRRLEVFNMNPAIAYDPYANPAIAEKIGVELVELDELLRRSDFVSVHCPLTPETKDLIGERELGLLKPGSYVINAGRGGIVNEDALYNALESGLLGGAAMDCFEVEPGDGPSRFGKFENVMMAPHAIAWTDELFRDMGRSACQGMVDLANGKAPFGIINPEVLDSPGFQAKWDKVKS